MVVVMVEVTEGEAESEKAAVTVVVMDVKIIIEETSVPAERVKLVGLKARVGRVNDDMRLADLVLKLPTQKVIVMGTPDEELLREPSSPVEIFDDLSDRPIQITKYTKI